MTLDQIEAATMDSILERRNYLMALWAGRQLGYGGDALADYVRDVSAADRAEPGPYDVVRKLVADLARHGVTVTAEQVLAELTRAERSVRAELNPTD
jgi:hypothetical protein